VYFERDSEVGGYTVTCPALNNLTTEGDTLAEARRMIKDAIVGYVEWLIEDGEPIPKDKSTRAGSRQEKIRLAFSAV
jgi:predicted RNase H-like HicB family nuclease